MNIGDIVTKSQYTATAIWCNKNNAHIERQDGQYVIVANPDVEPQPAQPTEMDRISAQVMYTAVMTDTLLDEV